MTQTIIDLNDSEIRVAAGEQIIIREPGYAVLKPDRIITGNAAWNIARSNPREVSNRFWNQLNQDPLAITSSLARHNADLVYNHLVNIHEKAGKPDEILFSVPGFYNREQLSLLLGVVEACPFVAVGLVDTAVASASGFADKGVYTVLDINLHNTAVTKIEVDEKVARKSVKVIDNVGLAEIYDSCANLFSDILIDQTRFDPLHHAETEQVLYNNISTCLEKLNTRQEATLEFQFKDARYQAKIPRETLVNRLDPLYQKIYREIPGSTACLIGDRLNLLPGFTEPLSNSVYMDEMSVFRGCLLNMDRIRSSGPALSLVTELPATARPKRQVTGSGKDPDAVTVKNPAAPTTHLLIDTKAYALTSTPVYVSSDGTLGNSRETNSVFSIGRNGRATELFPVKEASVYINGQPVKEKTTTHPGDIITFNGNGVKFECIEVIDN